jgi:hypothetical protein
MGLPQNHHIGVYIMAKRVIKDTVNLHNKKAADIKKKLAGKPAWKTIEAALIAFISTNYVDIDDPVVLCKLIDTNTPEKIYARKELAEHLSPDAQFVAYNICYNPVAWEYSVNYEGAFVKDNFYWWLREEHNWTGARTQQVVDEMNKYADSLE